VSLCELEKGDPLSATLKENPFRGLGPKPHALLVWVREADG
jgi:hypothetical protein